MSAPLSSLFLATVLMMPPPQASLDALPQAAADNPLAIAVAGIWKDAEIGTTADYKQQVHWSGESTVAPAQMRNLVLQLNEDKSKLHVSPGIGISFLDDHVTFTWGGALYRELTADTFAQQFGRTLGELGYTRVEDAQEIKRFTDGKIAADGKPKSVYSRRLGASQSAVVFEAQRCGRGISEVRFTWTVSRDLAVANPTVRSVFAVLPAWARVKYFSDGFYEKFADEPLVSLSSGDGISLTFAKPIEAKIAKALEAEDFEFYSESSPFSDGTVQKSWDRYSDTTFAGVRIPADGKTSTFYSQSPQNKADPKQPKRPPRHPVTTLPQEKRPQVAFDKLVFDNDELREVAKRSHDLAESVKQEKWLVEQYKDLRRDWNPNFVGTWRTPRIDPNGRISLPQRFFLQDLPFCGMEIDLSGKHAAGIDRLTSVRISGKHVPLTGWAASVYLLMEVEAAGKLKRNLFVRIGIVGKGSIPAVDFDVVPGRCIYLGGRGVRAQAHQDHFVYDLSGHTETATTFDEMRTILATEPEALRDYLLDDFKLLRKIARENLEAGQITVYDSRDVRSDNPPRPKSVEGALDAEVKKQLWDHVEQQLTADENLIRNGFREAHAAITKALPLDKVLGETQK